MNKKLLNLLLLISFQFGYLQWGRGQSTFIFQATCSLFTKSFSNSSGLLHPFILIPFTGMLILLFTLFQQKPGRKLTLVGLSCLSVLMLFIFFIGIISLKVKIILSALPFMFIACLVIFHKTKPV